VSLQARVWNIFTSADEGLGRDKFLELGPKLKSSIERSGKSLRFVARREKFSRFVVSICCSETCNLAFGQRKLNSSDARGLSGAKDICNRSLLQIVDMNEAVSNLASEQLRQLDVWHQVKATGEVVSGDCLWLSCSRDRDAFERGATVSGRDPRTWSERHAIEGTL